MIKGEFINAVSTYNPSAAKALMMWKEIESHYHDKARHYHNLDHIESIASELLPLKDGFRNWPTVVFAIVYHDIIYKTSKSDNEEKSAELAGQRLLEVTAPTDVINRCKDFILATKKHLPADDEIDLFTDADLSILGSDPGAYLLYTKKIRKEYSLYPDLLYKPGRRKVLEHFLNMDHIFKSAYFRDKYESSARRNIVDELGDLHA